MQWTMQIGTAKGCVIDVGECRLGVSGEVICGSNKEGKRDILGLR